VPRQAVAATHNPHKLREFKRILSGTGLSLRALSEFPPLPEVVEDGKTLEVNAAKKAEAISAALNLPALSDDSGLFVPALGGDPGVRSARYAGPSKDYTANNHKLLRRMAALHGRDRRAYFATAVAFSAPGFKTIIRVGKIWGTISAKPSGQNGFGYDPVFVPRGAVQTFAEMSAAAKNRISHRALALRKMAETLKRIKLEK
jgi:non-canonical purine NTP pyrophosphatase (RdgB/HAM1 family)